MSRTYRRRNQAAKYRAFESLASYTVNRVGVPGRIWCTYMNVPIEKDTEEYKIKRSEYFRDKTYRFKEPGPGWFRNMFSTRPLRGKARKELHKFMRSVPVGYNSYGKEVHFLQVMNECYEPMIDSKGKLPYWT